MPITQKSHLIWGILFKDSNTGVIHIKVITQHCGIQVPSQDTPPDPNNQGQTFQDLNIGQFISKSYHSMVGIQVFFQASLPKRPTKKGNTLQGSIIMGKTVTRLDQKKPLQKTVHRGNIFPRVDYLRMNLSKANTMVSRLKHIVNTSFFKTHIEENLFKYPNRRGQLWDIAGTIPLNTFKMHIQALPYINSHQVCNEYREVMLA